MTLALKRIKKELKYFEGEDCEEGYTAGPDDESDMYHWTATIQGPENSPYEGGTFTLKIEFPEDYPFRPPKVTSKTKVYHPNIKSCDGSINLDITKDEWRPDLQIIDVLKAVQTLLEFPKKERIFILEKEIFTQYIENKEEFEKTAREWTEKYAQPEELE